MPATLERRGHEDVAGVRPRDRAGAGTRQNRVWAVPVWLVLTLDGRLHGAAPQMAHENAADSADSRRPDISSGGDPPGIRRRPRSAGRAGAAGRWVGPGTRQGDLAR